MPGRVRQMRSMCGALNRPCTSKMVSPSTWSWMMEETSPTWSTQSTLNCWQVGFMHLHSRCKMKLLLLFLRNLAWINLSLSFWPLHTAAVTHYFNNMNTDGVFFFGFFKHSYFSCKFSKLLSSSCRTPLDLFARGITIVLLLVLCKTCFQSMIHYLKCSGKMLKREGGGAQALFAL